MYETHYVEGCVESRLSTLRTGQYCIMRASKNRIESEVQAKGASREEGHSW